ncbi:hypothetical protein BaRGS_00003576 [Batillaria attramentaria]|uniref:PiggyBac transposable element-derived protein 4 C-terminal zinc-finger domain-containing protein n=1 Tax=Batillaria attramentaria TaxID=370345 RepID=A0ABD0M0Z5_9CAEN
MINGSVLQRLLLAAFYEGLFLTVGEEDHDGIVGKWNQPKQQPRRARGAPKRRKRKISPETDAEQIPSRHCLEQIPPRDIGKRNPQKRCRVCQEKGVRRDSRYYCPACPGQPGFCRITDCFMSYHVEQYGGEAVEPKESKDDN